MAKFRTKNLRIQNLQEPEEEGQCSSIPLVLHGKYQWNKATGKLAENNAEGGDTDTSTAKLRLVPEALDLLKTIDKPVAVLAICGPYRSGKSYFLSSVVGQPGAFEVAHKTQVCTRGIWLSTTALECDEYVLLLMDTEGTGALEGKGSEFTTKFIVTTILLSSFLIYNSMDVPKQTDLQQMSSFAHLSTAITIGKEGKESKPEEFQKHFPHFMWLLRDAIPPCDENGEDMSLIDYLNAEVLRTTGQKDSDNVVNAICTLFPQPLHCEWLPMPEDPITPRDHFFVSRLQEVTKVVMANIQPKVGFYEEVKVTGQDLAKLATLYVEEINKTDSVPSLEGSWKAVIKLKLAEEVESLVASYEKEMNEKLKGEDGELRPMEESSEAADCDVPTLLSLHEEVFERMCKTLKEKVNFLLPKQSQSEAIAGLSEEGEDEHKQSQMPGSSDESEDEQLAIEERFKHRIVVKENGEVKSGVLLKFTTANLEKSKSQCEGLWSKLKMDYKIDEKYARLLQQQLYNEEVFCDGIASIAKLREDYNAGAIGPARESVRSEMNQRLRLFEDLLHSIPGPPVNVRMVGKRRDAIKLQWAEPKVNPTAAKKYIVEYRQGRNAWVKDKETTEQWHIVKNLKSNTTYEFRVSSWNDEANKAKRNVEEILKDTNDVKSAVASALASTQLGKVERAMLAAVSFIGGTVAAPVLSVMGLPSGAIMAVPFLATLGAPIVGGVVAYEVVKATGDWGDLKECFVPSKNTPPVEEEQSACDS